MATFSAREFNQDVSAAKRAAAHEPVIITDRGLPSHVLLSIDEFHRLIDDERDLAEWLSMKGDIEFDATDVQIELKVPEL